MTQTFTNPKIIERFDELIDDAKELWEEFKRNEEGMIMDIVRFTRWATSSLNLLDKLSVSTNRFVNQFEIWVNAGLGRKNKHRGGTWRARGRTQRILSWSRG